LYNIALIYGCASGHEEIVHVLLDSGADVKDHNEDGHIPLMKAAGVGHVDIVSLLIAHADVNIQITCMDALIDTKKLYASY